MRLLEKVVASHRDHFSRCSRAPVRLLPGCYRFRSLAINAALDLPNPGAAYGSSCVGPDEILLAHGGRLYLAKDATTTPDAFHTMYPNLAQFRRIKARVDPNHRFVSSQSRRLKIIETT